MTFWEKITGSDMTKQMKEFDQRVEKLPQDYKVEWEKIKSNLWPHSNMTGRNLMPILDTTLGFLEQTAADGQSAKEVLGEDIKGFCAAIVGEEGAQTYRDKWRRQLNSSIERKLSRQE